MGERDIRSLDIGMLRTFEALMRDRSVSRAAESLFLSQPAVSASLNRLRETFTDPLFTRTGHGVAPTARALELAPRVEQVLADIGALLQAERTFDPETSQRIFRIAASDFPGYSVLPILGRTLAACGSPVRLLWEPLGTWSLEERLERGDLDVAMVARLNLPRELCYHVLCEDHFVYAVRRGHPLEGKQLTLDAFCTVPQVFLGYGTHVLDDFIDEQLARRKRQRRAQIAVSSFGQILHLLQCSDHAAVLPRRVADAHVERLTLFEPPFELPHYQSLLCWHAQAHADPGNRWLRGQILQVVESWSSA